MQTIVVTEGGGVVTSTAVGSAPVVTATAIGQAGGGNIAPAVVTQYVTAQVTGTDAQGRTTTGETVEQVILTVTATAAGAGGAAPSNEPQIVTLTATNANQRATGGVVIVTLTESATSTEADGKQVVVLKVSSTRPFPLLFD